MRGGTRGRRGLGRCKGANDDAWPRRRRRAAWRAGVHELARDGPAVAAAVRCAGHGEREGPQATQPQSAQRRRPAAWRSPPRRVPPRCAHFEGRRCATVRVLVPAQVGRRPDNAARRGAEVSAARLVKRSGGFACALARLHERSAAACPRARAAARARAGAGAGDARRARARRGTVRTHHGTPAAQRRGGGLRKHKATNKSSTLWSCGGQSPGQLS
jgi:hypothetical protein